MVVFSAMLVSWQGSFGALMKKNVPLGIKYG